MQVSGKLTVREAQQIRQIVWAPHYRLNLFNNYIWRRFFPFMGAVLAGAIATEFTAEKTGSDPRFIGVAVGVISALCIALLVVRWHHLSPKELKKLNAEMPESIMINEDGVLGRDAQGISTQIPWSALKSWRASDEAIVLDFESSGNLLPVPLSQLSREDQETVREIMRTRLGKPTFVLKE